MDAVALITMIAVWCGNPSAYRVEKADVNTCRTNLIKCIDAIPSMDRNKQPYMDAVKACAVKEKL